MGIAAAQLKSAQGMTLDTATNRLFILDPAAGRITVLTAAANGRFDENKAVQHIPLPELTGTTLRGLAFDPASRHLHLLDVDNQLLVELSDSGELLATRSLAFLSLANPQALAFAPSADRTDDPGITTLYLADAGRDHDGVWVDAKIVELSLTPPTLMNLSELVAPITLVRTTATSSWSPPSPDPAGVDYLPAAQRLVVGDSEVEEMPIYAGANMFLSQPNGTLTDTCTTLPFSKEPTGLAVNPTNSHIFISDDGPERIFEINIGADNIYCTSDDTVTWLSTEDFNSHDPEGVAFGEGHLFVADGVNTQIYRLSPGANGIFDGVPPAGDDTVTDFDTAVMGLRDPEGIGFHHGRGTLFIVSRKDKIVVETTPTGSVVNVYDIDFLNAVSPAGLGTGPGSANAAATSLYLVARGVDNNSDPNENDGKLYELTVDIAPTPTATPGPSPTPGPTPTPSDGELYASFGSNLTLDGVPLRREDIAHFDGAGWSLFFDGSDVEAGSGNTNAFNVISANTMLLSFNNAVTLSGAGTVQPMDIVLFQATSLGENTAGTYSLYFDGSDVGLDATSENIDALTLLPDGRLILSFKGSFSVPGVSGKDEDLVAFTPGSLGDTTSGTWAMYFDGSDVGLSTSSSEDVNGVFVDSAGALYLSTLGEFAVATVFGSGVDIFTCAPVSLGDTTACNFSPMLFFDGSTWGLTSQTIDAFDLP
jgi:uncharacterized protein YjiK